VQAVNEFGGLSEKGTATDATTGIDDIYVNAENMTIEIYDVRGLRHEKLTQGVNIVKQIHTDGHVKVTKIVVK